MTLDFGIERNYDVWVQCDHLAAELLRLRWSRPAIEEGGAS